MSAETARKFEALEAQANSLMEGFSKAGYELVAPAILLPADIFLDQIGEAIRNRTYVFTDLGGEELCLRPDLTVPTCRLYLERHPEAGSPARYSYNGPVFRYQPHINDALRPREFRHAGLEYIGAHDKEKAEAEVVALAIEAVRQAGVENFTLRLGDLGLFFALLNALHIPEHWRRRLKHSFWNPAEFRRLLKRLCEGSHHSATGDIDGLLKDIDQDDFTRAQEQVSNFLDEQKIELIGNRGLEEITKRVISQAADTKVEPLSRETADLIENYLAISGPPKAVGARIGDLAGAAGLDLSVALRAYTARLDLFTKAGVDIAQALFSAEFGRNLEYYTGLVFQIEIPGLGHAGQIAGGGRYDRLLESLGAPKSVPAVGLAIHTERLLVAVQGESE